jgi:hypothetical protein
MSALALQASPTLPLAQAWWLGTHRRMDLLDVPSFHPERAQAPAPATRTTQRRRLHRLPTALPNELLGLHAYLAGGGTPTTLAPLAGLALLLRYLAAPLTFQADNPYGVHRAVPSPRCAHPCRVAVLERHAAGVRCWSHEGDHHALTPIDMPCDVAAVLGPRRLAVVGIARHWVLADKYGDFAPYNSMLESGMAQAQLQHLAAALGWQGEPLEHDPAAMRAALSLCEHPLETISYGLRIDVPSAPADPSWPGPGVDTDVASLEPSPRLMRQFDRLPQLAAQFSAIGPRPARTAAPCAHAPSQDAPERGLLDVMRSRSAGNDRSGLAPLLTPLPAGSRDALLALWRDLGARRGALAGEAELEPLLLWLDESDGPASLHDLHGRPRALPVGARPRELLRDALPNVRARHNVAALKCHAMWCADLPAATARHGAAALRRLHLAAGAQAQDLCLAAAALGLFARPVRMLREEVLEGGLGLPGPLAYQVMCGLNRSTNTHWSL